MFHCRGRTRKGGELVSRDTFSHNIPNRSKLLESEDSRGYFNSNAFKLVMRVLLMLQSLTFWRDVLVKVNSMFMRVKY